MTKTSQQPDATIQQTEACTFLHELAECVIAMKDVVTEMPLAKQTLLARRFNDMATERFPLGHAAEALARLITEVRDAD